MEHNNCLFYNLVKKTIKLLLKIQFIPYLMFPSAASRWSYLLIPAAEGNAFYPVFYAIPPCAAALVWISFILA